MKGLGIRKPDGEDRAVAELDDLTEGTGGIAVQLPSMAEADATALGMARRIRQQYTLGYTPSNQALDGSYRKIHVVAKGSQKLSAQTRAGYYATTMVR